MIFVNCKDPEDVLHHDEVVPKEKDNVMLDEVRKESVFLAMTMVLTFIMKEGVKSS